MQKMKKIMCLLVSMLLLSSLFMIGCKDDEGNETPGQMTDAEWQEMLSVDIESINSVTITDKMYSSYGKDQAEEYGEWYTDESTVKIDKTNEKIYFYGKHERFIPEGQRLEGEPAFETSISSFYCYKEGDKYYKANYYSYSDDTMPAEWTRREMTKAEFIQEMENFDGLLMAFEVYSEPMMKSVFKYNESTGMYEMADYGGFSIGLKFSNDGVTLYESLNSLEKMEVTCTAKNKTTVTIPDVAKNAPLNG